jgi:hypothetical protein
MIQKLLSALAGVFAAAFSKFKTEPALCIGAVDAVLVAAVTLGLPVDPGAKTEIDVALLALAAVFTRSQVSPAAPGAPGVVIGPPPVAPPVAPPAA